MSGGVRVDRPSFAGEDNLSPVAEVLLERDKSKRLKLGVVSWHGEGMAKVMWLRSIR